VAYLDQPSSGEEEQSHEQQGDCSATSDSSDGPRIHRCSSSAVVLCGRLLVCLLSQEARCEALSTARGAVPQSVVLHGVCVDAGGRKDCDEDPEEDPEELKYHVCGVVCCFSVCCVELVWPIGYV
jgi:hypothetical protein